jgi:arylsulfatase A-like enzyme
MCSSRLFVSLALLLWLGPVAAQQKPNILFLFADDMRPDTIAALGNEHIVTPNLDKLAREGMSFDNAYCQGGWHGAVCIASRAMLMTGRDLTRVKGDMGEHRTLPQHLADVGYACFATGKWHNGKKALERSFAEAEAVMLGGMSDHFDVPLVDLDSESRKFVNPRRGEKHSSEIFARSAVRWLEGRKGNEQPFFCYVAFQAPHDPRDAPRPDLERYYRALPPLPKNFRPQVELFADGTWDRVRDEKLAPWPRTEAVIRQQLAEYYGLITHLDRQVGRVLQALTSSGHAANTLIVFAADHGLAVGSHGLVGKQSVYEHSMGTHLILHGERIHGGIPVGRRSQALVYLHDLNPTLLEVAGVPRGSSVEEGAPAYGLPVGNVAASLWPVVRGEVQSPRETLALLYRQSQRSVRNHRYKLIRFPEIDRTLLFDLWRDPDELDDLSASAKHRATRELLESELRAWQQRLGDDAPWTIDAPRSPTRDLSGLPRKPDRWQPEWIRKKYFR